MSKLLKESHVHVPCLACGKTARVKLKWALKHKSMKCPRCKASVDLRANPARSLIARMATVVTTFDKAMEALHAEAKKTAKAARPKKKPKQKKSKQKKTAKKRPAKKAATALAPLPPSMSGQGPV